MKQEELEVEGRSSAQANLGSLVLSARNTKSDFVELVVGRPGLPNVQKELEVGDSVLFETPDTGVLEVRVLRTTAARATVLVSQVSPRQGILGGLVDDDPDNSPFTSQEIERVKESLEQIKLEMSQRHDLLPEQLDLISRKLDDMQAASERLGRKDWMHLAIGTLTSIVTTMALDQDLARGLFQTAQEALSWLFQSSLKLLT